MKRTAHRRGPIQQDAMTHDPIDESLLALLAEGLAPVEPPPARRQAMRERILAGAAATSKSGSATGLVTVRPEDGIWQPLFPGVEMKLLHDHGDAQSFLLRLAPGARMPVHGHGQDELCMVLEGEVRLNGMRGLPGTFHLAQAGSEHAEVATDSGCLLFIKTDLERGVLFR